MSATEETAKLTERIRDMIEEAFPHMKYAVFVFGDEGRLGGASNVDRDVVREVLIEFCQRGLTDG